MSILVNKKHGRVLKLVSLKNLIASTRSVESSKEPFHLVSNSRMEFTHFFSRAEKNVITKTGSPNILCTELPRHWRSNKALPSTFKVFVLGGVTNGTKVTLTAANEENMRADMRNFEATIDDQVASFVDLRFVGRSGRGGF